MSGGYIIDGAELTSGGGGGGGDVPLPTGSAEHHWRCDEAASPFADLGSAPVPLVNIAGTRLYQCAGLYRSFNASRQITAANGDRMQAAVGDYTGTDFTFGVTFASFGGTKGSDIVVVDRKLLCMVDGAALTNNSLSIKFQAGGIQEYARVAGGDYAGSTLVDVDWSLKHSVYVSWATATSTIKLYLDGYEVSSRALGGNPQFAVLDAITLGGGVNDASGGIASRLLTADVTIHRSVLSASEILAIADACTRLY